MMTACTPPVSPCVDFVVVGEADCTGGLSFADIGTSLLNHNPTRAHVRPVLLTSNHAKKQHFYLRHATGNPRLGGHEWYSRLHLAKLHVRAARNRLRLLIWRRRAPPEL